MLYLDYLNPKMLIADKGKVLKKDENYTSVVFLGKDEDVNNWTEIDEKDVPKPEETENIESEELSYEL